jgi:tRNA (guanine-N7-)-methyltransferase
MVIKKNSSTENKKSIRSFVLRQGRMTKGQQAAFDNSWQQYGIDYTDTVIDIAKQYKNHENPLIVEIGFGNGKSLIEMAQSFPDKNYLGIEVHKPGVGALLIEVERLSLENLKCIHHDAVEVLTDMFSDESIDAIQLFFPDPWPKKKHHKRRIVQKDFLSLLTKKLKPSAYFHMATDWQPYAEDAMEVLSAYPGLKNTQADMGFSPRPDFRPKTKFEARGESLGHGVWDLIFEKL